VPSPARPLVVGIGNDDRSDDGAGLAVARALEERRGLGADVRRCPGELTGLLDLLADRTSVILVDAARSRAAPGSIHRWTVTQDAPFALAPAVSTHGLSLSTVLELARSLGTLPPRLVVYGIEIDDVREGRGLSPAVGMAVRRVAQEIADACATSPSTPAVRSPVHA
jgi:hydrogenase maturation protease